MAVNGRPIPFDRVESLLRETAAEEILPRWKALADHEVEDKGAGEIVTAADHAAERRLTEGLAGILSGALVVGEEAAHTDPSLLGRMVKEPLVWLVDPLDGTRNFARGDSRFAIMLALLAEGQTRAAWILDPLSGSLMVAEHGGGCFRDETRVRVARASRDDHLKGCILTTYMPEQLHPAAEAAKQHMAEAQHLFSAGHEYPALIRRDMDFMLYYRTLPWDHAPGMLLLSEAGGYGARLDGSAYRPGDGRKGLLAAAERDAWYRVHAVVTRAAPSLAAI